MVYIVYLTPQKKYRTLYQGSALAFYHAKPATNLAPFLDTWV